MNTGLFERIMEMKIIIALGILLSACPVWAEDVYYRMSQKDYIGLCSEIAACHTNWSTTGSTSYYMKMCVLEKFKDKLERYEEGVNYFKDADAAMKAYVQQEYWSAGRKTLSDRIDDLQKEIDALKMSKGER